MFLVLLKQLISIQFQQVTQVTQVTFRAVPTKRQEERDSIFRIVAAVLHLGQVLGVATRLL